MVGRNVDYELAFKTIDSTKNGCDKKCDVCPIWMPSEKMCWHDLDSIWEDWNKKQKAELKEIISKQIKGAKL